MPTEGALREALNELMQYPLPPPDDDLPAQEAWFFELCSRFMAHFTEIVRDFAPYEAMKRMAGHAAGCHARSLGLVSRYLERVDVLTETLRLRDNAIQSMVKSLQHSQACTYKLQKNARNLRQQIALLEQRPQPKKAPAAVTLEALRVALDHGRCKRMDELESRLAVAEARVKTLEGALAARGVRYDEV